jgi:hypothetical protein
VDGVKAILGFKPKPSKQMAHEKSSSQLGSLTSPTVHLDGSSESGDKSKHKD